MIEGVKNADQFLYHHTTVETAIAFILKNKSLKFGRYTGTNDPKEAKTWDFDLGTNGTIDLGKYDMREVSRGLSGDLKERARVACFSKDTAPLSGNHLHDIFRRGYCKPRMWAQYASKHAGVCIVFERAKLAQLVQSQFGSRGPILAGPVTYVDRSVVRNLVRDQAYMINIDVLETVGRNRYAALHLRTHYQRLFFEKMADWRDESEWRWIVFADTADELLLDLEDSIAGVMFGEVCEEKAITEVMNITEGWGIRRMGLKWKNCSPWYDYANLRYVPGIIRTHWAKHVLDATKTPT